MPKVLISGLFVHPGKVGGAETYLYNLLKGFEQTGFSKEIVLLLNQSYSGYDPVASQFDTRMLKLRGNRAFYDYLLPAVVDDYKSYGAVFQPCYITPLQLPGGTGQPARITNIVDLLYLNFPQFFSFGKRSWLYLAHLNTLRRASKVICISDFVKEDVIQRFGEKYRSKLHTIHNPIDFSRFDRATHSPKPYDFDYILSVSAMYPHKNTLTLLKAFREYKRKTNSDLKLVLVGQLPKHLLGSNFSDYHQQIMAALQGSTDIITTGYIPDQQVDALYHHCRFFVYPSLFEGFGMPVAEAMGAGKLTITTRCASLPEISMGKAIYVDNPTDTYELAEKMTYCSDHLDRLTEEAARTAGIFREKYSVRRIASEYQRTLLP